jgi:hypothetical protein
MRHLVSRGVDSTKSTNASSSMAASRSVDSPLKPCFAYHSLKHMTREVQIRSISLQPARLRRTMIILMQDIHRKWGIGIWNAILAPPSLARHRQKHPWQTSAGRARGAGDGDGRRLRPAPPPGGLVTSAGLPRTPRLLCHMMLEKTVLRRCLTATCHPAPAIAMLDARLSSISPEMGRLTRRCRRV